MDRDTDCERIDNGSFRLMGGSLSRSLFIRFDADSWARIVDKKRGFYIILEK